MANKALLKDGIKGNYAAALDDETNTALQDQLNRPAPHAPPSPAPAPSTPVSRPSVPGGGYAGGIPRGTPSNAPAPPPTNAPAPAPYVGTPANSNTQGFVQGKLNDDTLGTTHKYNGGRYLTQHPGDVAGLVRQPGFEGWTVVGPDKVKGPGGSVYDVRNANGSVQWTAVSGPAWDKNGIAGVNSLGVNSSMAKDGIKGNYAAANAAASDAAGAAGTSRFGYAGAGGAAAATPKPAEVAPAAPLPQEKARVAAATPTGPLPRDVSSARVKDLMDNGNPYGEAAPVAAAPVAGQASSYPGKVAPDEAAAGAAEPWDWEAADRRAFPENWKPGGAHYQAPAASAPAVQDLTDDHINEGIMRLLARGERPVDRAAVEDQYSPVSAVMQRSAQRQKAAAAERGAFQGTNIGGAGGSNDAQAQQIDEATGMQQGQLMAQLIGSEMTQRRADVAQALQSAQGAQKLALERQLSLIDAELRKMGLEQQNQQFYDQMGYNIGRDEYNDSAAFNNGL